MVAAGRGDLQGLAGRALSGDVRQVGFAAAAAAPRVRPVPAAGRAPGRRSSGSGRPPSSGGSSSGTGSSLSTAMSWRRLRTPSTETPGTRAASAAGAFGDDDLAVSGVGGGEHRGQHSAHRADPAVEPQFADHHQVGDGVGGDAARSAASTAQATARSKPLPALRDGRPG